MTREQHASLISEAKERIEEVPPHLVGGILRYLELGIKPGGFLCSVIENDLQGAVARSTEGLDELRPLCQFFYNFAPSDSWGSKDKRIAWQRDVSALVQGEATP